MMTQEKQVKERIADKDVERISWRQFIRNQFRKIMGFLFLLVLLFSIISLSAQINPDSSITNPDGVVDLNTPEHLYLVVISTVLFILVLAAFTKIVLLDHREEFGITSWRQRRVLVTFMLTTSFISLVYILLDVSLINIYFMTFPTWVIWIGQSIHPQLDSIIPNTVDRLAYSQIRGYIFVILLTFMFLFPLTMFINILTRYGRSTITKRREEEKKLPMTRMILGFIASGVFSAGTYLAYASMDNEVIAAFLLFLLFGFLFSAAIFFLLIIFNLIRFGVIFSYTNFLLIFPFIFLFYLLPGALWGLWDLTAILTSGSIENTIYATNLAVTPNINPETISITDTGNIEILSFYLQTVYLNLRPAAFLRIIQLDFIIVVGVSAVIIGFAEGYSILAIFRSLAKGVSIAKTGRVASQSAPKMIVITSRLFYLVAWLSFFWDNLIILGSAIATTLKLDFSLIELPFVLEFVVTWSVELGEVSTYLLVFAILAVPFYFILTSAFKFLSVSLALEKVQNDKQVYYLLISSAFILIVTNIFADIAALPDFQQEHFQFLPLAGPTTQFLLPFVAKIFDILESIGFYTGVVGTVAITLRNRIRDKSDSSDEGGKKAPADQYIDEQTNNGVEDLEPTEKLMDQSERSENEYDQPPNKSTDDDSVI